MKLLVDVSIILDFVLKRQPYVRNARLLMELGKLGEFALYVSASQVPDLYYVLSEGNNKNRRACVKQFFATLRQFVAIAPLDEDVIDSAVASSQESFDDACILQAARVVQANLVVTHNKQNYDSSVIPAANCEDFFMWLEEEKGVTYAELALE